MKPPQFPALLLALLICALPVASRADDLAAMEGKWKVDSAEAGGHPIDPPELMDLVVTIMGNSYEVLKRDGTDRGSLKLDEAQKPKTMDATDTEGQDAGKIVKAIYELSGDTLRVCYAMTGDERPTKFATEEGAPLLLLIYKREK